MFDRNTKRDVTLEASRENSKPRAILKPRKVRNFSLVKVILHEVKHKWSYENTFQSGQVKKPFNHMMKCLQEKNSNSGSNVGKVKQVAYSDKPTTT